MTGSGTGSEATWPRPLSAGARVALVAPGGPLEPERIRLSERRCEGLGLEPVVFPSAGARRAFLAGSDAERLADLQDAFDDPSIDAVWALRGGYGTLRIIDGLKLGRQQRDPIPFVGFSDNTTIHVRHADLGVVSFHGPHPGGALTPGALAELRRLLFSDPSGDDRTFELSGRPEDPLPRTLFGGRAVAPLFGGNLTMLASLCGSSDALSAAGRILFLEDVGEAAYRVDRMLIQLERAGVFERVSGIAFGRFTEARDGKDEDVGAVLEEFAQRRGVPTVADLPFGHVEHHLPLPLGAIATLDADRESLSFSLP